MEINYLILAHNEPLQVGRLVRALNDEDVNFYIHVDKSISVQPFSEAVKGIENIYFLTDEERQISGWGNLLNAIISGLQKIIKKSNHGYIIVISGQDYPIKSKSFIKKYLSSNYGTHFMEVNPLPYSGWKNGGMDRLLLYRANLSNKKGDYFLYPSIYEKPFYDLELFKKFFRLMVKGKFSFFKNIFRMRKIPSYIKPFGGSDWWALPIETVKEMFLFLDKHKDYYKFFQDSLLASEVFFQTILMNLPSQNSEKLKIKPLLTYVVWSRPGSLTFPYIFTASDFKELMAQEYCLFARKFSKSVDEKILDLINEAIKE